MLRLGFGKGFSMQISGNVLRIAEENSMGWLWLGGGLPSIVLPTCNLPFSYFKGSIRLIVFLSVDVIFVFSGFWPSMCGVHSQLADAQNTLLIV